MMCLPPSCGRRARFAQRGGYRTTLNDRAAACGARASRAAETVIAGRDLAMFERIGIHVPQKNRLPIVPLQPELLIEIAVINFPTPPDADRIAAHETFDSRWIERLD